MTAGGEPLDTAALRERGPYITSMASDGYPSICVDTDSWNAMCAEIDRLRTALSAVGASNNYEGGYRRGFEHGQRAAVGVGAAPAEPSKHEHDPAWCVMGGGWACQACLDQQRADPVHVQQPAEVIASVTLPANTIKVGDRIDFKQPAEVCDEFVCEPDCGFDDCAVKAGRCCWQGHQDTSDCSKGCCLA